MDYQLRLKNKKLWIGSLLLVGLFSTKFFKETHLQRKTKTNELFVQTSLIKTKEYGLNAVAGLGLIISGIYSAMSFWWTPTTTVWKWLAGKMFSPLIGLAANSGVRTAAALGPLMGMDLSGFISSNKSFISLKELSKGRGLKSPVFKTF